MLVYEDKCFNREFPEEYEWTTCDSIKLSQAGDRISRLIKYDLKDNNRNYVPGLRKALLVLAEYTEI